MSTPTTILDVVALVNALPKPVTLSCFLETLARPLDLYATRGIVSAQPARGERSPRLFLFSDPLILTIVPEGVGSHLLEMGELQSETRSLKAELEFPVVSEISEALPFEKVVFELDPEVSNCAFCHADEERVRVGNVDGFVSQALRPAPVERVALARVLQEVPNCDPAAEPERCAMLNAVFQHGEVRDRDFPAAMATFY
ncbi:MAG TPA: hypothetical protein VIM73_03695 [Polyangiaceae bacterium]